jgi:integrase
VKLTESAVAALRLEPDKKDIIHFDDAIPGLGVRLRKSGVKVWIFQYKLAGKTRRVTLGAASAIKAGKARDIAAEMYSRVRLGGDPASDRQQQVQRSLNTFGWLSAQFFAAYKARPRTVEETKRHLLKYCLPLHPTPIDAINRRQIADLLGKLDKDSGAATANRVRSSLSALFSWAMSEGLTATNPTIGVTKRQERPRERVLGDDELARIWRATGDDVYGTIIKLLILTAQRRGEISGLRWEEIDFDRGVISLPGARTKNHRPHSIPITPTARGLLQSVPKSAESLFSFDGWGYAKRNLDKRSGVSNWVVHDLRRSVATGMADLGVQPHIIETILNHVGGFRAGVGGVYNRSPYEQEKRQALELWDRHIMSVMGM